MNEPQQDGNGGGGGGGGNGGPRILPRGPHRSRTPWHTSVTSFLADLLCPWCHPLAILWRHSPRTSPVTSPPLPYGVTVGPTIGWCIRGLESV